MKKNGKKILIVLICLHELLLVLVGMGLALMIECGKITNGATLILPLAILLISLGWMLRSSYDDIKE